MKLPRKIKKKIPTGHYCYSIDTEREKKEPHMNGGYWIKPCPFYKRVDGLEGYCSLFKVATMDQVKECGMKLGKY